jgi:L-fuconolactonase
MQRLDSHHHFWSYSSTQYPWISDSMLVLRKDFLPSDLLTTLAANQIHSVVTVQARQSVTETQWLLELAKDNDWIRGVVGWLPLSADNIEEVMESYHSRPKLVGLRHVIQDEPDDGFMSRKDFNRGVKALGNHGWVYDLLVFGRQLPFAIPFVDCHPQQHFVLDHIAKPVIQGNAMDTSWEKHLRELAKRPNVDCKFSGVATEVRDAQWTVDQLRPYWDVALDAFGSNRLMFGSDWPVCLLKTTYSEWVRCVEQLASELSYEEQCNFWHNNATRAYNL